MELYHSGYVVDDIEQAMAEFGGALGLTWADVTARPVRVVLRPGGEPVQVELLATYSRQGPPYVELIQELSGGVWSTGQRLDHLGFWVPDLAADFARLSACGLTSSVQSVDDEGRPSRFSYQRPPTGGGPWIELVDESVRPDLLAWISGERYVIR